jgi:hypothetical protein
MDAALELLPSPEARRVFEVIRQHPDERLPYERIAKESGVPLRTVRRTAGKGGYIERVAGQRGVIPLRFHDERGRFEGLGWHFYEVATPVATPDGQAVSTGVATPDEREGFRQWPPSRAA